MWVMRSTGPGSKELLIEQVENLNTEVVERKAHNVVIASVDATNQRTTCCLLDPISARFVPIDHKRPQVRGTSSLEKKKRRGHTLGCRY